MDKDPRQVTFAIIGFAVPAIAFLWEFVLFGSKRLSYRGQMDTTAIDEETAKKHERLAATDRQTADRPLLRPATSTTRSLDTL